MKSSTKKFLVLALMYGATLAACVLQRPMFGILTFIMHGMVVVYATAVGMLLRDFVTDGGWWMLPVAFVSAGGLYMVGNAVWLHDGITRQSSAVIFAACMFAGMIAHSIRFRPEWGVLCLRRLSR